MDKWGRILSSSSSMTPGALDFGKVTVGSTKHRDFTVMPYAGRG